METTVTTVPSARIRTPEVASHIGETVRVAGWLHSLRRLGGVSFLVVRDGWGVVQAVVEQESELEPIRMAGAGVESVLAVSGRVVAAEQAPGGVELREISVEVIEAISEAPPVALNKREIKASLATILETAVVTNRHPARRAILRLGAGTIAGFRQTLLARDFT
ncbi:MAG TPA: OB-fold nucleic acid binding domain-containing protein, partial [Ktedonobacterales bacterium]|nr:OB-fold nucleic acid binding domain-containing protein [Ktedonobacterales bacterium]